MRVVIQRVSQASVTVEQRVTGQIQAGLVVLLGVEVGDTESDLAYVLKKTIGLRIFNDEQGKLNLAIRDVAGELLVVSQFTLLGDVRQGNRPSFISAAAPEVAQEMYEEFVRRARAEKIVVQTGVFRAEMQVQLTNTGPVTIVIDSRRV